MIKLNVFAACRDNGDGSTDVTIFNTEQECLDRLGKTQEEIENGCYYDDGIIRPLTIKLTKDGKLAEPIYINDIE